jgi:hypothetical protein
LGAEATDADGPGASADALGLEAEAATCGGASRRRTSRSQAASSVHAAMTMQMACFMA